MLEYFNPPTLYKSSIYSHAVKGSGRIIFVAGQCSHQPQGESVKNPEIIHKADPYGQARQCHLNVKYALEAAGASLKDVVKINTYSTHPDFRTILIDLRKEFFPEPPYPASTGVVVTALFDPHAMFEIEVVAIVED